MKYLFLSVLFLATTRFCHGGPLRIQKRAVFYVANETACVVDDTVYSIDDPIPTDNPCETCRCRPPGFACVLVNCVRRRGCKEVLKPGQCCPDYICDSDIKVTTPSDKPTSVITHSDEGRVYSNVDNIELSKNPPFQEAPENHFASVTLPEGFAPETQDSGSSSSSQTPEETNPTPQSIQNTDSTENVPSETNNEPQLFNTDPEVIGDENVEKKEPVADDISKSPIVDSDDLVPLEPNVPKGNVEIFADDKVEEPKSDTTTTAQDLPSSVPITTEVPTENEKDIETNTIEKRFRSLQNVTLEETTETKEPSDAINTTNTKPPEAVVTEAQEKYSTFQETGTSTHVPDTDTSKESSESESKDESSHFEVTTNAGKGLEKFLFPVDKISVPESHTLETVTAVVNVHEETTGSENDGKTSTSVSPSDEQNLSTETNIAKETPGYEHVNEEFSEIPY